jgi:hypothetical protein
MNPTSRALRVYLKKKGFHDNKIIHWTNVWNTRTVRLPWLLSSN